MNWLSTALARHWKLLLLSAATYLAVAGGLLYLSNRETPQLSARLTATPYQPGENITANRELKTELYFNEQPNGTTLTELITQAIRGATTTIEVAMYSFDSQALHDELLAAAKRGVRVSLVLSKNKSAQHQTLFAKLPPNVAMVEVGGPPGGTEESFMHHKFALFDRGTGRGLLFTGSLNWTELQARFDPSFLLVTRDPYVVRVYGQEFERLQRGVASRGKFREPSYHPWAANVHYRNGSLELWWSPGFKHNAIKQRILDAIASAHQTIEVMIWQMTDQAIARALTERAREGVRVTVITDDFNIWQEHSAIPLLFSGQTSTGQLEVIDDAARTIDFRHEYLPYVPTQAAFNSFLHLRALIVDGRTALFGTNNWSGMANTRNDESIMVTDVPELVQGFRRSFTYHYQHLRGSLLKAQLTDGRLILPKAATYVGDTLVVVGEHAGEAAWPVTCSSTVIKLGDNSWPVAKQCADQHLNVYVLDKKNTVVANALIPRP